MKKNPKHILQTTTGFENISEVSQHNKNIYYGTVVSIHDDAEMGRIKVRINEIDLNVSDDNLPLAYPLRSKYFHAYPRVGEMVRIVLENNKHPNKGRYWDGSIISQLHKIEYEDYWSALTGTERITFKADKAPSTNPDSIGVFPNIDDIGLIGRYNTDVLLKKNEVLIRAGKHEEGNILKLNKKNPAQLILNFEKDPNSNEYYSNLISSANKIALISHSNSPKIKTTKLTSEDRSSMFEKLHPIPRGDVLVEALNLIRKLLLLHVHGYSGIPPVVDNLMTELQNANFNAILNNNIVIN